KGEQVGKFVLTDLMGFNGKKRIYQMTRFADGVKDRGGQPREPLWYKKEYLRRLDERIHSRIESIRSGRAQPDDFLVFGARHLLENLRARGLPLYLASGTDEQFVKTEADLLDLRKYFGPHIYGALDDHKKFSKKMVIERNL